MKKVLYFAYGSNMLFERLNERVGFLGEIKVVGTYKLYGWRLVLNCGEEQFTETYANIVRANQNSYVEGVLYEISSRQFKLLDKYEGLYVREIFQCGDELAAVYISYEHESPVKPRLMYINILLAGASENGLNETYKKLLEFKKKNYKLKKFTNIT